MYVPADPQTPGPAYSHVQCPRNTPDLPRPEYGPHPRPSQGAAGHPSVVFRRWKHSVTILLTGDVLRMQQAGAGPVPGHGR